MLRPHRPCARHGDSKKRMTFGAQLMFACALFAVLAAIQFNCCTCSTFNINSNRSARDTDESDDTTTNQTTHFVDRPDEHEYAVLDHAFNFPCSVANLARDGYISILRRGILFDTVSPRGRLRAGGKNSKKQQQQQVLSHSTSTPVTNCDLYLKRVDWLDEDEDFTFSAFDRTNLRASHTTRLHVFKPPQHVRISAYIDTYDKSTTQSVNPVVQLSQDEPDNEQVLAVRHNSQLSLNCVADGAKPHTELVWFDARQKHVDKREPKREFYIESSSSGPQHQHLHQQHADRMSYAIENVARTAHDERLESSNLSWSFRVNKHEHAGARLECRASHIAWVLAAKPEEAKRMLRSNHTSPQHDRHLWLRLDVQYEPNVTLLVSTPVAVEGEPLELECAIEANPSHASYRWLLAGVELANASQQVLRFERTSLRLDKQEIRCVANNSIGIGEAAYVMHIQPAPFNVNLVLICAMGAMFFVAWLACWLWLRRKPPPKGTTEKNGVKHHLDKNQIGAPMGVAGDRSDASDHRDAMASAVSGSMMFSSELSKAVIKKAQQQQHQQQLLVSNTNTTACPSSGSSSAGSSSATASTNLTTNQIYGCVQPALAGVQFGPIATSNFDAGHYASRLEMQAMRDCTYASYVNTYGRWPPDIQHHHQLQHGEQTTPPMCAINTVASNGNTNHTANNHYQHLSTNHQSTPPVVSQPHYAAHAYSPPQPPPQLPLQQYQHPHQIVHSNNEQQQQQQHLVITTSNHCEGSPL